MIGSRKDNDHEEWHAFKSPHLPLHREGVPSRLKDTQCSKNLVRMGEEEGKGAGGFSRPIQGTHKRQKSMSQGHFSFSTDPIEVLCVVCGDEGS